MKSTVRLGMPVFWPCGYAMGGPYGECSILNRPPFFDSLHSVGGSVRKGLCFMPCLSCASDNQAEFSAEMIIHFSGLKNLDKLGVWAFPRLLVCLDCGSSRFSIPRTDLALLASGTPAREPLCVSDKQRVAVPIR